MQEQHYQLKVVPSLLACPVCAEAMASMAILAIETPRRKDAPIMLQSQGTLHSILTWRYQERASS